MNDQLKPSGRPQYHFAPATGWLNDPNGLVKSGDVYHLFFQYYPHDRIQGPMHWGHATSTDLANWVEQPIALYPDALGNCFSGSAVPANDGTVSGAIEGFEHLLFYTASLPREGTFDLQTQCLALANNDLSEFTPFADNPIISNPGIEAFRDPKVMWHKQTQRWIMVVTHGQSIGVYSSIDAIEWQFESTFGEKDGCHGTGPWECPDLFPLVLNGAIYWILVVGIGTGGFTGGSGTQYFVGQFDGKTFTNANEPSLALWLDYGTDYYAAQTWAGMQEGEAIAIAWMSNWNYARQTPTEGFRGAMTLPRRLAMTSTTEGLRLQQQVAETASAHFTKQTGLLGEEQSALTIIAVGNAVRTVLDVDVADLASVTLHVYEIEVPLLTIERNGARLSVRVRRGAAGRGPSLSNYDADASFGFQHEGKLRLDVFMDAGLVEVGIGSGVHWVSSALFPVDDTARLEMRRATTLLAVANMPSTS